MKILTILCLATLLSVSPLQSSQESPELQEATTLTDSLIKLFGQKKYDDALPLAKRALQIREKLLPPDDQRVLSSLFNLGEVYLAKKENKPAREIFLRLVRIQEQRFGPEDVRLANTFDRLGLLHYRLGKFDEAEVAYKSAVALREKHTGANQADLARAHYAIAEFYRARSRFAEAASGYKHSLLILAKTAEGNTPEFERAGDGLTCMSYADPSLNIRQEWNEILRVAYPGVESPEPGKVLNGMAIELPIPPYPAAARVHRYSGTVVVKVEIDETGKVIKARDICNGPPYLSDVSVAAAWKARFTPTKLSGMPVKVVGIIQYNFVPR